MNKSIIRKLILRREYSNQYILEKSNIIKQNLFNNIDFNNINTVHIYLSKEHQFQMVSVGILGSAAGTGT